MIRCVRIWTGDDDNSLFEEGVINLDRGPHGDILTGKLPVTTVSFQETGSGGKLDWHTAPVRTERRPFYAAARRHFARRRHGRRRP
jgi:hypothetical protein